MLDWIADHMGWLCIVLIAFCFYAFHKIDQSENSRLRKRIEACSEIHKAESDEKRREALIYLCSQEPRRNDNTVVIPMFLSR